MYSKTTSRRIEAASIAIVGGSAMNDTDLMGAIARQLPQV